MKSKKHISSYTLNSYIESTNLIEKYKSLFEGKEINVLDLGCGSCNFLAILGQSFDWVSSLTGVDKKRSNFVSTKIKDFQIDFIVRKLKEYLESSDNNFSLIIMRDSIHFEKSRKKRLKILKLCYNRLEDEGCLYIKVASKKHEYEDSKEAATFSKDVLLSEIHETKFHFVCEPLEIQKGESFHFLLKKSTTN